MKRSLFMQKARDMGLQGCQNKLPVDVIMSVSLAVSRVHADLSEFPRYFHCLIF